MDRLAEALRRTDDDLVVICSEGDSIDDTGHILRGLATDTGPYVIKVVDGSVGSKREWGPTTDHRRMKQFAHASNAGRKAIPSDAHVAIVVESDLDWDPEMMAELCALVRYWGPRDVRAPICLTPYSKGPNGRRLYDTWAFRRTSADGGFSIPMTEPFPWTGKGDYQIYSAGSCLVMPADVARVCEMTDDEAVVGFCRQFNHAGYRLIVNEVHTIWHP
jgi:hypothetical protein